jgi:hypothetical protein
MISLRHLDAPGADYDKHATDYLGRTDKALAQFIEAHGALGLSHTVPR